MKYPEKVVEALIKQTNQLMKANQQLIEALIAKNAYEYAAAKNIVPDSRRPAMPQEPNGPAEPQADGEDFTRNEVEAVLRNFDENSQIV